MSVGSPPPGVTLVGVGPGDPDLLTIAAWRAIRSAAVVAYPVSAAGAKGMAAAIAAPWIAPEQRLMPLIFPMVSEAGPRQDSWRSAADVLAAEVAVGAAVVLLCEGDVSLFASSSYVLLALQQRHPQCPVHLIPGVTAVSAAAAAAAWPLALQNESLCIRPTPNTAASLQSLLDWAIATEAQLALLKLGHRWRWVKPLLAERDLLAEALFVRRVGWPDQWLARAADVPMEEQPYFSLLLMRFGWPKVLP